VKRDSDFQSVKKRLSAQVRFGVSLKLLQRVGGSCRCWQTVPGSSRCHRKRLDVEVERGVDGACSVVVTHSFKFLLYRSLVSRNTPIVV